METINRSLTCETQPDQLLPGIPNDITFDRITTKLPWRTFHVLSSVSHGWLQAIRSHQVLNARARTQTTETLAVVHISLPDFTKAIALYSVRDKWFCQVPPIPQWKDFPSYAQCVSLDGKLYVLGGKKKQYEYPSDDPHADLGSNEMYMLDLAGQRQWRQCSRMREARHQFGCGVIDGKIYVFGGTSMYHPVCGSEVYDPKTDVWSPISPMRSLRFNHDVTTVGRELVVHGGEFYEPDYLEWWNRLDLNAPFGRQLFRFSMEEKIFIDFEGAQPVHPLDEHIQEAFYLEAYNPVKDEWRVVESDHRQEAFSLEGYHPLIDRRVVETKRNEMLCSISWHGVDVRDMSDGSLWTNLHSFTSDQILPTGSNAREPFTTIVADGELLAIVHWFDDDEVMYKSCLVQSRGFCSDNRDIVWQKAQRSGPFDGPLAMNYIMCPIQI